MKSQGGSSTVVYYILTHRLTDGRSVTPKGERMDTTPHVPTVVLPSNPTYTVGSTPSGLLTSLHCERGTVSGRRGNQTLRRHGGLIRTTPVE